MRIHILWTAFFLLGLCACGSPLTPGVNPGPTASQLPIIPPTIPPTSSPIPLAAIVNGDGITKAEFGAEFARYLQSQANLGNTVSQDEASQVVMSQLVDTLLLVQGANTSGFSVDDALLQQRMDKLISQLGGASALAAWESAHGYSDEDFRKELRRQIAASWMTDRVTASVPVSADQVHVKQILLYNASDAQQVLGVLQAGTAFEDLAARYDPLTKGDLGWFPRGYLPDPAIEAAAFDLQPGQYSAVVQDETGYHILFLVERDPARLVPNDARLILQAHALQNWLVQRRKESIINYAP